MEGGKKIIAVVVLLAIIAAAVMFWVKRSNIGGPKPPQWYLDQEVERIDAESLELVTRTIAEWQDLGFKNGKFKNPNTKKYTMVSPIVCDACGEKIPPPEFPVFQTDPSAPDDIEARTAVEEENRRIMSEYMCPKCGGQAFAVGRMVP